jgi:hypothetical protein
VLCEKELLCNSNHGAQQVAPAESSLQRIVSHVTAAGITAGRSSEVFGIVMPVSLLIICYYSYLNSHLYSAFTCCLSLLFFYRSTSRLTSLS